MSADQAADSPVIDDIVDVLNFSLGFWIAALVVNPEIVRVGDVGHGIGERTKALRIHALSDDAILKCDVVAALGEAEAIPSAPFDAAMIEHHIAAAGKVNRAFTPVACDPFAETQVPDNDIFLAAEGYGTAV